MDRFITSRLLAVLLITALTGCSGVLPTLPTSPPVSSPAVSPTAQPSPSAMPEQTATPETPSANVLRLWVPPQFDPDSGTPAGSLLKNRLNEFGKLNPDTIIEVRVKAASGVGGLLDALITTSSAAPTALPDLIALPRETLEAAALKGVLHPYGNDALTQNDADWYDYARQLSRLQNSIFGLPFAGDTLLLIYRPAVIPVPPSSLTSTLEAASPLVFPAADPQALFTLALYEGSGGAIRDAEGRPTLSEAELTRVLTFYAQAESTGLTPAWLADIQTDEQAWQAFQDQRTNLVITWSSRYLNSADSEIAIAPLPTLDGEPFSLATGWVWALASPVSENQGLSVKLAEFLTENTFLAQWTEVLGYLPTRPGVLAAWSNKSLFSLMDDILLASRPYPSNDILASLGAPLQQAALQMLKKQSDPLTAAQFAIQSLTNP
ncbi:MAG: extracellular solute-binding protein [Anaerolineales bacterium]|nr:extracellular solute-binding protein [Anaerolineales bacterium]